MAYAINGNAVCQATFKSKVFGQTCINTFHWRLDLGGGTLTNGALFLDDFFDELNTPGGFNAKLSAAYGQAVLAVEVDLQWIDPDRFRANNYVVIGGGLGAWLATTANTAATLELRGDIADKRGRGIKHIPGIGGTAIAQGLIAAPTVVALQELGLAASFDVLVGARIMSPIVFGRARAGYTKPDGTVVPPLPKAYRPVTSFAVPLTSRVMRRRTVGVGI